MRLFEAFSSERTLTSQRAPPFFKMLRRLLLQASITRRTSSAYFSPQAVQPSLPALPFKCCLSSFSSSSTQIPNNSFIERLEENANPHPQTTTTVSIDRSGLHNPPGTSASPLYKYFLQQVLTLSF